MLLSASFTCLDACCCHGLRLPVFNKETTYLLTYTCCLFCVKFRCHGNRGWSWKNLSDSIQ